MKDSCARQSERGRGRRVRDAQCAGWTPGLFGPLPLRQLHGRKRLVVNDNASNRRVRQLKAERQCQTLRVAQWAAEARVLLGKVSTAIHRFAEASAFSSDLRCS
jgi:hypothetical protein